MKEIARHISRDNISQWNRTIGRVLDTGLSELGLHCCLEKSSTLSKFLSGYDSLLQDQMNTTHDEIEDEVNGYVQNLSSIIWKLRYEHFHYFIFCLCSLPHTSSYDAISSHLHVNNSFYPMEYLHRRPDVIQTILKRFLDTSIPESTKDEPTDMKKKIVSTRPKTIIKKLGSSEGTETSTEMAKAGVAILPLTNERSQEEPGKSLSTSSGGQSYQLLESVLDFNSLFLLLPSKLYPTLRKSFNDPVVFKELCVQLLTSLEYSENILSERLLLLLFRHSSSRLGEPLPVDDILTNSLHLLILHTNSTTHHSAYKKIDWEIIFRKMFTFQQSFDSKFWLEVTTSFLQIDPMLLQKSIHECQDLYANRYEAYQALIELLSLNSVALPTDRISVELFFQTHIFLFSNDILEIAHVEINFTNESSSALLLPFQLNSFSSAELLSQLFNEVNAHLQQRVTRDDNIIQRVIMVLTHLLRIWKWGSRLMNREQKIQSLFEFWASRDQQTNDAEDKISMGTQLDCFVVILELCSKYHLHEEFLDVLLLDILSPDLFKSDSFSSFQPHMVTILELSESLGEEYYAWVQIVLLFPSYIDLFQVRLYSTAFFHGLSSKNVLTEAMTYLDTIEKLNQEENPFHLSLVLLLQIPASLYRGKNPIFYALIRMTFACLDNRFP